MSAVAATPASRKLLEADAALTAPGAPFEIVEEDVLGERMPVFARRPRSLRDVLVGVGGDVRRPRPVRVVRRAALDVLGDRRRGGRGRGGPARRRYGVGKGDRVAICAANCPEWLLTFWACAALDAVLVAMNGWWTGSEMRNALELTRPTLLVMDEKRHARLDDAIRVCARSSSSVTGSSVPVAGVTELPDVEIAEDDPFELIFTSGTTGRPKAAVLSHRSVVSYLMMQSYVGRARCVPGRRRPLAADRRRLVSRRSRCSTSRACRPRWVA